MGCAVREKHIRTNRRPRSVKPDDDQNIVIERTSISNSVNRQTGMNNSDQDANANPNPNFDDSGWGYCTEEQLEEILLKNLEVLYNEAISKLVSLGYDEDVALKAILRNGHYYGGMDVLTNIFYNSLAYLNSGGGGGSGESLEGSNPVFVDLRQLEEYSLAGMVCLLQQVKQHLSKVDAMWCLLMSDLHVGRACVMEIPILPSSSNNGRSSNAAGSSNNVENAIGDNSVSVSPPLCRFHGGWGFPNGGSSEFPMNSFFSEMNFQREIECLKRFNLTPSMKFLLKRNVAAFAAGFKANSKHLQMQSQACPTSLSTRDLTTAITTVIEDPVEKKEDLQNLKSQDAVNSVVCKLRDLNLDENAEYVPADQKDEMILSLIHQIIDLEEQMKERKVWAHEKAMQAARKLSNDLREIKILKMGREKAQPLQKEKPNLEDTTMKRLTEMENALRMASGQVDDANAALRELETENAEIRAEMEASKLSASESVTTRLEVAKREKKCLKRLLAWETQKSRLQEEISTEKQKILELQQRLVQVKAAQKEAEAKWKQEQKEKEVAVAQVKEERRLKEATETSNKRKLEALRLKIEVDFQRRKDDLQRLEQELSRLKTSAHCNEPQHQSTYLTGNPLGAISQGETIARLVHELDKLDDSTRKEANCDRKCLICLKEEVSVVFLPCAHEVLCANCNDNYGSKGKATCPCCQVPIEERIRIFGPSS